MTGAEYVNPRTGATWPTDKALWKAPDDGGYGNLTPERPRAGGHRPQRHSLWRYATAMRLPQAPEATPAPGGRRC